jgi:hypothetical protein
MHPRTSRSARQSSSHARPETAGAAGDPVNHRGSVSAGRIVEDTYSGEPPGNAADPRARVPSPQGVETVPLQTAAGGYRLSPGQAPSTGSGSRAADRGAGRSPTVRRLASASLAEALSLWRGSPWRTSGIPTSPRPRSLTGGAQARSLRTDSIPTSPRAITPRSSESSRPSSENPLRGRLRLSYARPLPLRAPGRGARDVSGRSGAVTSSASTQEGRFGTTAGDLATGSHPRPRACSVSIGRLAHGPHRRCSRRSGRGGAQRAEDRDRVRPPESPDGGASRPRGLRHLTSRVFGEIVAAIGAPQGE